MTDGNARLCVCKYINNSTHNTTIIVHRHINNSKKLYKLLHMNNSQEFFIYISFQKET